MSSHNAAAPPVLAQGADNEDLQIKDLKVPEEHFDRVGFHQCRFLHCDLAATHFRRCLFEECHFEGCNLSLLGVEESTFVDVSLRDSRAGGIDWSVAKWPSLRLLSALRFEACDLSYANFFGMHLEEIAITDSKAIGVDFRGACLAKAQFAGTDLREALFVNTDLRQADLVGATNYAIDPRENKLKGALVELPEALGLLEAFDVKIV